MDSKLEKDLKDLKEDKPKPKQLSPTHSSQSYFGPSYTLESIQFQLEKSNVANRAILQELAYMSPVAARIILTTASLRNILLDTQNKYTNYNRILLQEIAIKGPDHTLLILGTPSLRELLLQGDVHKIRATLNDIVASLYMDEDKSKTAISLCEQHQPDVSTIDAINKQLTGEDSESNAKILGEIAQASLRAALLVLTEFREQLLARSPYLNRQVLTTIRKRHRTSDSITKLCQEFEAAISPTFTKSSGDFTKPFHY